MSEKRFLILAVLLVAAFAVMAGCTSHSKTAKTGDNVSVDYIGSYENGTIFDTSIASVARSAGITDPTRNYAPISFTIGNEEVIPGFENAVTGMKVGETKNVTLQPADAYGDYDPTYIQPVNMSDLLSANITPYVNQTLITMFGQQVRVDRIDINQTDYNSSQVYIDFNEPMAGKVLKFSITLRSIEASATPTK
jgi:peptidylprolyl isomerase